MGYQLHLPPRYLRPLPLKSNDLRLLHEELLSKEVFKNRDDRKRVKFNLDANRTARVPKTHLKDNIWYTSQDFEAFESNWKQMNRESETPIMKKKRSLVMGKRVVPPMEDVRTFSCEAGASRRRLIRTLLEHQSSCKAQGFSDPDGYSILSKTLSLKDRKVAWEAGAVNAYEVHCFEKELTTSSLPNLFMDYYLEAIHPHLHSPLAFMTKVLLCQCD